MYYSEEELRKAEKNKEVQGSAVTQREQEEMLSLEVPELEQAVAAKKLQLEDYTAYSAMLDDWLERARQEQVAATYRFVMRNKKKVESKRAKLEQYIAKLEAVRQTKTKKK